MKRLFILLIIVFLAVSVLPIYAEVSEEKLLVMEPSMDIILYPDGSIAIEYKLNMLVKQPSNMSMDGFLGLSFDYYEDGEVAVYELGGATDLILGNISGNTLNETALSIRGDLVLHSREIERKAVVESSILAEFSVYNESACDFTTKGFVNVSRALFIITPETHNISFTITISKAIITIPSKYINNINASKIINEKLAKYNLTYVRFENLTIVDYNNTYFITGNVSADNKGLLATAIDKGLITPREAEEITYGLSKMLKDVDGVGRIVTHIVNETYVGGSKIIVKHEASLEITGNIQEFREELRRFGPVLAKYMCLVINVFRLIIYGEEYSQPLQPLIQIELPPVYEPKLAPVYPYSFTLSIDAGFNITHAKVTVDIEARRLRYSEPLENLEESLRASLREVRDFLINISKPLTILELMGIGSPIPKTIHLYGARLGDKVVDVKPKEVTLPELADVKILIHGARPTSPTTPTVATTTITKSETLTTTMTTTVIHTTTITEKTTETTVVTEKYTETTTYIPPETTILNIGLGSAVILLAIATTLLTLMLKRKS